MTLSNDLAAATQAAAALESQLADAQAQLASLTTQYAAAQDKVASLTTQYTAAQNKVTSLEAEVARLQTELTAANAEIVRLKALLPPSRDPLKWPYPPDSIWNHPLGNAARLQPLKAIAPTNHYAFRWEEDILIFSPDSPKKVIKEHNAGWTSADRCASRTGRNLTGNGTVTDVNMPIPGGWNTVNFTGSRPNHSTAIVYRDGTDLKLFETQPFHICADGVPISQFVNSDWVGDSILTGGKGVKGGAHGGSYMTAFGGTIRLGEWVPGGEIKHATKFVVDTNRWCAKQTSQANCFRWPALRADSGAVNGYGSQAFAGLPTGAKMGMLVALPASFNVEGLQTEPAKIFGRSLARYGSYLVDGDAGLDVFMVAVEWSHEGRVIDEFQSVWGIKGFHKPADGAMPAMQVAFLEDMRAIEQALCLVDDNSPTSIGGAGSRLAPWAPPLSG